MLIDRTHRKWLIVSLVILAAATAIYIPYAAQAVHGPSGGSAVGLAFGIAGFAVMVFAGLLSARKKVPVWRVGRAQTWMRGHLWLGLLSLPLILFHAGFRFGGALTRLLMALLIFVVTSGVLGAILQHYMPRRMTAELPMETIYEQIDHVREQLRNEAEQIVASACGQANTETGSRSLGPRQAAAAIEITEVDVRATARLQDFYSQELRPYLEQPGQGKHRLSEPARAAEVFHQIRILLPAVFGKTVDDLESICEEERQLTRETRLHLWLHGWLLVHIPLSFALLLLGAVHAVMALRF
jgi:hypothetical protein